MSRFTFILTVPELEQLLSLQREAIDARDSAAGYGENESEHTYFAKIDELAERHSVSAREIQRDISLREAGYYHEAHGRSGIAPRWRS